MDSSLRTTLAELARQVADGTPIDLAAACGVTVSHLADLARRVGVAPGATAALVDPTSPEVARQRAFGLVVSALASAAGGRGPGVDVGRPGSGEQHRARRVVGHVGAHGAQDRSLHGAASA